MSHLLSRFALMSGNFITGLSVLAPAGMLHELSSGLGVTIRDAGLLVTYGAVILCFGSPVLSWLTTRMGRRLLLTGTLAIVAAGHVASAFADSYAAILLFRIAMLVVVALYTPQAASTIALIVPEKDRASALAFVFLGWSIAIAVGLPLITWLATQFGWRETYLVIGVTAAAVALLNVVVLPRGLKGYPLSLQSFTEIARSKTLLLILLITLFQMSGQFSITIYMAPVLQRLADAGPAAAGIFFAILGVASLIGNVIATSVVGRLGVPRTLAIFMLSMICGSLIWAIGGGILAAMAAGMLMLGLGVTAANSMQQARLIEAAPALASATVALNTSFLYFGQALGSASASILFDHGYYRAIGFVAVAFFLIAFTTFQLTELWRKRSQ
ncbi:MFS transporter [Pseudorhodoplanes sinuspersici]|uniref:MFS transporter n=1 Tax=Pseudorhodoplanes sinuspersici TaxID=1235591 RepID=A0A1W6ZVQ6_9HYPH|nr:MFS transporter [Pseudorhodoplanes sinuspersici]ARQ01221.1 MFS transporter [Pseudorhodoplanes sinuspersici]RKE72886.1 putative MFS family arabinose efflux permease [Pseudorhodoplanes sinuspersici]